jgi:hypothetical protein
MMTGIILRLIEILEQAFCNLQLNLPAAVVEDLAVTVHKAMSVEGRHYHTPEHVLSLASPADPIQSLAALFHDIVYYQVDRGFSSEVMAILRPYIDLDAPGDPELPLPGQAYPDDLCYQVALDIFDFKPGQKLFSTPGFNEFLSALVMAKKLRHQVPNKVLLQVIVYIEATIPFRGKDEQGYTPFDGLEQRLRKASQDYHIPLSEEEIIATIRGAVVFANKDVENFAEKDPALFLVNTWKLLPETHFSLRAGGFYSIRDYRLALQHTDTFFSQMVPELVFHRCHGVPTDDEYWELVRCTRHNVSIARQYLGIKLLAIGILEALAESTGGDAPLSLFMGEARPEGEEVRGLGDYLPHLPVHPSVDTGSIVYNLLDSGRASPAEFTDLRNSPLSIFIYRSLGPEGVADGLELVRRMFAGNLEAGQLLQRLDSSLISAIAEGCAIMVPTRSEKLRRYVGQKGQTDMIISDQPEQERS